jgi:Ca-activated chloride channel family protein
MLEHARFVVSLLVVVAFIVPSTAVAASGVSPGEVGAATLLAVGEDGASRLPMVHASIELDVAGVMLHGTVEQTFHNDTGEVVEAVYLFPLPDAAAVHEMEMRIGGRRIVAEVREKERARRAYETARDEGRKAALVEGARPHLFRVSVASLGPGESVEVMLRFAQEIRFADGRYRLAMPLTVTPRHDPSGGRAAHATRDEDAARGPTRPASDPRVPHARVVVRLTPGLPITAPRSSSHRIARRWEGETLVVEPATDRVVCDRDFLLEWAPRDDDAFRATLLHESRGGESFGLLLLTPPLGGTSRDVGLATETVYVVDRSGSMDGPSIEIARAALASALERARPGDAFDVVAFDERVETFAPNLVEATPDTVDETVAWVRSLDARGGTDIPRALDAAFEILARSDTSRVRRVVLLTDGGVANEREVFARVRAALGDARLHVLGIGSAPNRWLMRRAAEEGRGVTAFLTDPEEGRDAARRFFERIDRPVVTIESIETPGTRAIDVLPSRLPDLHAGTPLVASLRFADGRIPERVVVRGRGADGPVAIEAPLRVAPSSTRGVALRWARARVAELVDSVHEGAAEDDVRRRVVALAERFGLATRYTSLVAVEEFPSVDGPSRRREIARALPAGHGVLPATGTLDPLARLVGLLLIAAGALALAVVRSGALGR